jgi:predicted  nucleic acid-binding Zn-ribbon protein
MTSAADLLALQDIDLKRDSRRALLADIESRLGETEELIAARAAVAEAEAALEVLRRQQRDLDAQLQDLDAKIAPFETKLYGGSVRNPKELTDLQKEVDSLKARRGKLDDDGLNLLDAVENATNELAAQRAALEVAESNWRADQEAMNSDRERAQRESGVLDSERERWTTGMDKPSLQLYENLRIKRQGRAVARVERGTCQGCRIGLPTHLVQRVRTGAMLVQCPTCERILVGV